MVAKGATAANLNPLTTSDTASLIAIVQIYDQLVLLQGDKVVNSLAKSMVPNSDATSWTIQLHSGATFHDGRPVTAADVAYSLRTLGDPKRSPNYSQLFSDIDAARLKVRDRLTLEVPLHRARGDLRESALSQISIVFPEGTTDADWNKGIGSGPFKLSSIGPSGVVLARNETYWDGAPLLDGATVSAVADADARLNAVRGGQADYAVDISPAGARTVANSTAVQIVPGGPGNSIARSFEMNVGTDPFTNANVRLAMKLLVDRRQLVDSILLSAGARSAMTSTDSAWPATTPRCGSASGMSNAPHHCCRPRVSAS
jgi:peptide/nickel transport system substrate-binding protein